MCVWRVARTGSRPESCSAPRRMRKSTRAARRHEFQFPPDRLHDSEPITFPRILPLLRMPAPTALPLLPMLTALPTPPPSNEERSTLPGLPQPAVAREDEEVGDTTLLPAAVDTVAAAAAAAAAVSGVVAPSFQRESENASEEEMTTTRPRHVSAATRCLWRTGGEIR